MPIPVSLTSKAQAYVAGIFGFRGHIDGDFSDRSELDGIADQVDQDLTKRSDPLPRRRDSGIDAADQL